MRESPQKFLLIRERYKPVVLHSSIPIVHMGTIHPYCTHGDHPSIPIVHMWTIHSNIMGGAKQTCTHGEMVGPLLPYLLLPPSPSSPHPPPSPVKPLVMMIFVLQNGSSPLLIASHSGHLDVVKTLIEAGANVNHTNKVGTCALLLYTYTVLLYCLSSASLCTCSCHNDVIGTNNYLSLQC